MTRLLLENEDFSCKLEDFILQCKKCGSFKVTIDIDWAAYPSCSWLNVTLICEDCKHDEEVYESIE